MSELYQVVRKPISWKTDRRTGTELKHLDAVLKAPGQSSHLPKRQVIFRLDFAVPSSKEAVGRCYAHVLMCVPLGHAHQWMHSRKGVSALRCIQCDSLEKWGNIIMTNCNSNSLKFKCHPRYPCTKVTGREWPLLSCAVTLKPPVVWPGEQRPRSLSPTHFPNEARLADGYKNLLSCAIGCCFICVSRTPQVGEHHPFQT